MRASGARLLLVCLGCPKQERWICAHHQETGIPLSIGVGASLDFITGKQKRAPRWMQKTGMEWFWRMAGSPSRLVSRYSKDLVFLVRAAIQQAASQRRRKILGGASRKESPPALLHESALTRLVWHGDLERKWLSGSPLPESVTSPVLLDASAVTFIDSAGLGQLAQLIRRCRTAEQLLVVVRPARVFQAAVSAVRMDALFPIVDSEAEALKFIARHQISGGQHRMAADGVVWVSFDRALDSLYYDEMMAILESAISSNNGAIQSLVVDLSNVGFIDSRAVGGLVRAWKSMTAMGGSLYLSGARPALREIIRLLKLDQILPEWKGGALE
jgi:N-acetylglucosaminyldiphosphoundecaprenol N-acetyl-beta-D-mannosaminyltransferase